MGRKGKRGRNKKEKGGKEDHAGAAAFADDARHVLHLLSHEHWHPLRANGRMRKRERERVCVCVYVCVCE